MTSERFTTLMADDGLQLSDDEIDSGWHFCWSWDGLLVGPGMMEASFCECDFGPDWKKPEPPEPEIDIPPF